MAAREPSRYLAKAIPRAFVPSARPQSFLGRRNVSDEAPARRLSDELNDLETASSLSTPVSQADAKSFDPLARSKARKTQLPRSRYAIPRCQPVKQTKRQPQPLSSKKTNP